MELTAWTAEEIWCVDICAATLAYAQRRLATNLCAEAFARLRFRVADIAALTRADLGTFDVVCCFGVLHHLPDPAAGWRRLAALLEPGGSRGVGEGM